MAKFTSYDIIYNPKSTGSSEDNAKQLANRLKKLKLKAKVSLHATKYAGHAEKLAYEISQSSAKPLIISSSGDGGYNEVINGAIKAINKGARPVCAVLASGNANDHSRTLQDRDLSEAITAGKTEKIDVLHLRAKSRSKTIERYAHSYIGLGLTPIVAAELNKTSLNAMNELAIVLRTFYKYRPFKINHDGRLLKLDSIIFANIGEMAKILTLSKDSKPNDGRFEIVTFAHRGKLYVLRKLVRATVSGLKEDKQAKKYEFTALKTMPAQLDGELLKLQKGSHVTITCEHQKLTTLL